MTQTQTTYTTAIEHEIVYAASVADQTINFETPGSEYDWAANILYADGRMIAQSLAYGEMTIEDYPAVAAWLRANDTDLEIEDTDESEIRPLLRSALRPPDSDYDDLAKAAKEAAIAEMLGTDGAWDGYRIDGRFANEYTLILCPRGEDCRSEDAAKLTAEDWATAWGRYPDAITISGVSLFVQDSEA